MAIDRHALNSLCAFMCTEESIHHFVVTGNIDRTSPVTEIHGHRVCDRRSSVTDPVSVDLCDRGRAVNVACHYKVMNGLLSAHECTQ